MTAILSYVACALLYDPQPHDAMRFGLPIEPGTRWDAADNHSAVRHAWQYTLRRSWCARRVVYLNEQQCEAYWDALYRAEVWYIVDDLCDASRSSEARAQAGRRLRDLIGPFDYYAGVLPSPTP